LRAAGILPRLRELGLDVVDHGDLPRAELHLDSKNVKERNLGLVCQVARTVAAQVRVVGGNDSLPLILGGDCTITIGVLAGLLAHGSDLGLMYFDGDLDLNTPETTPSGFFDGMGVSHILGGGSPELARIGPRCPLVPEHHLVFFAYNPTTGFIDPPELSALERSAALRYPLEQVRENPVGAAREALTALESRVKRILVHFDVDVSDFPAADLPHRNALPFDRAVEALKLFVASPKCAGLVVTEFNPHRDADGSQAFRLANGLADAAAGARGPRGRG
jgi:arginase